MEDQAVRLNNPFLFNKGQNGDILYHLDIVTANEQDVMAYSDVKMVIMGGTHTRMKLYAERMSEILGEKLIDCTKTDRYSIYKVGPIVTASHGVGNSSISILLHELIKLLHYAKCSNVVFVRAGTCGGIGVSPGTVVISRKSVDHNFHPFFELCILGKVVSRPSQLDSELSQSIMSCPPEKKDFDIVFGDTMCAEDFYECQARLDGAICEISEDEKKAFFKRAVDAGVRNIEMESGCFAAMCNACNIRAAVVCVTLLDRLEGDRIDCDYETLQKWELRPFEVLVSYIKKRFLPSGKS